VSLESVIHTTKRALTSLESVELTKMASYSTWLLDF